MKICARRGLRWAPIKSCQRLPYRVIGQRFSNIFRVAEQASGQQFQQRPSSQPGVKMAQDPALLQKMNQVENAAGASLYAVLPNVCGNFARILRQQIAGEGMIRWTLLHWPRSGVVQRGTLRQWRRQSGRLRQ